MPLPAVLDAPLSWEDRTLVLDLLPRDSALVSDPPTDAMVENVRQYGILQPILVDETQDTYTVIAGRRRIKAARSAGLGVIPARIITNGGYQALVLSVVENVQRRPNPLSDFLGMEALIKAGADEAQVARYLDLSLAEVKAKMRLSRLIPELREATMTGRMKVSVAALACRLEPRAQCDLLPILESGRKIKVSDVRAVRLAYAGDTSSVPQNWNEQATNLIEQALDLLPPDASFARIRLRAVLTQINSPIREPSPIGGLQYEAVAL